MNKSKREFLVIIPYNKTVNIVEMGRTNWYTDNKGRIKAVFRKKKRGEVLMEKDNSKSKTMETNFEVLIHGRPTTRCSCCHTIGYVDELHLLPEVEAYAKQMALSFLHKDDMPDPIDEDELQARYKYGSKSMFCSRCFQAILGRVFVS